MLYRSERGRKGWQDGIIGIFRFVADIHPINPDQIWILHRSWRYNFAPFMARLKTRLGFGIGKQIWFYQIHLCY